MLGCHDFCGYYDWTFHYVRSRFGQGAIQALWAEAIGAEAQAHYEQAGRQARLAGLLRTWDRTGHQERCDCTFTLDEARNVLRWDMRQCPSKGFLLASDLQADEDYCDHCMGWLIPLLERIGMRVVAHEHNHAGQCWAEIAAADRPCRPQPVESDIRLDPRWSHGYVDAWSDGRKVPPRPDLIDSADPCDCLAAWFAPAKRITVLAAEPPSGYLRTGHSAGEALLVTDAVYARHGASLGQPLGVLFGDEPPSIEAAARRFLATSLAARPLLMYTYLPGVKWPDFVAVGLPRPLPILPLLIRRGLYEHRPHEPHPTAGVFLVLLAVALDREVTVAGLSLKPDPHGQTDAATPGTSRPPTGRRDLDSDRRRLRVALLYAEDRLRLPPEILTLLPDG